MRTLYEILDVFPNATIEQLRAAYRHQAMKWNPKFHPDNQDEAKRRLEEAGFAYKTLFDLDSRKKYDATLKNEADVGLARAQDVVQQLPSRRGFKDYDDLFAQHAPYHERWAKVFAKSYALELWGIFNDLYAKINILSEEAENSKPPVDNKGNQLVTDDDFKRDVYLKYFKGVLDVWNLRDFQKNLLVLVQSSADAIFEHYHGVLHDMFWADSSLPQLRRYELPNDVLLQQKEIVVKNILGCFSVVVMESSQIESERYWLESNFRQYEEATDPDNEIMGWVKGFGLGALALANPLVGIPLAAAGIHQSNNSHKNSKGFVHMFGKKADGFADRIEKLKEDIVKAMEQSEDYWAKKFVDVNVVALGRVLDELAVSGFDLNEYARCFDYDGLGKLELKYSGQ